MLNRIFSLGGVFGTRAARSAKAAKRTTFLRGERLERRELMASDMYINTHPLWGGDVTSGDRDVIVSEFQMIGRGTAPTSLTFQSETGAAILDVAKSPELVADLYGRDPRGRLTLRPDGVFETVVARGSFNRAGDLTFRFTGIGTVLAQRGTDLQVRVDVAQNAEDGMPIAFGLPTVGFRHPLLRSNVHHIGYDNPVYAVNAVGENHLTFGLDSAQGSFNPGENNVSLGKVTIASDPGNPAYVYSVFVAIEGRHADNTVIADVDKAIEDIELRDNRTGRTYQGLPVAEVNGLEIVRVDGIYIDGSSTFEIFVDQEGSVADGDKFRAHVVSEPTISSNMIDIAGLTGLTSDYRLQAVDNDFDDRLVVMPGGILSGMFSTVEAPYLNLNVVNIGSSDVAVRNEKSVTGLRFVSRADGADLLLTEVHVKAHAGNLLNAQNAAWWVDSDGDSIVDTIVQNRVSVINSMLSFSDPSGGGYIVADGEEMVSEIRYDVASSLQADNTLQLALTSVKAEQVADGASLPSGQILASNLVSSKVVTFVNQGNLIVTKDATPTRSRQLLGGTLGDTILRVEARAEFEDIDMTRFFVSLPGDVRSIDRLELYRDGATTAFATATVSAVGSDPVPSGYTTFLARMENAKLVVPEGQSVDILVRPRMKSDEQGALSGEIVTANVLASFASVQARGRTSSANLLPNDGDAVREGEVFIGVSSPAPNATIAGNANTVVLSKITNVANANPDADNTSVPTGIAPVGQFRFTAASNANTLNGLNKFELVKPVFSVSGGNESINVDMLRFYNKADSTTYVSAVAIDGNGNVLHGNVVGSFRVTVSLRGTQVDRFVESGQSDTFVLAPQIVNPQITPSTSSLQISLLADETQWADPDIEAADAVFTGLGLSDSVIRSTLYRS